MVFLRLYKGYSTPSATNRKLSQQRTGPFQIVERIGRLAYRLKLPDHWRIHDVFAIDHLEPAPHDEDLFSRPRPDLPDSVHVDGDTKNYKSWEVEKLIKKRVTPSGQVKYLLRWKGWGPEYDEWRGVKDLDNAADLVDEYEGQLRYEQVHELGPDAESVRISVLVALLSHLMELLMWLDQSFTLHLSEPSGPEAGVINFIICIYRIYLSSISSLLCLQSILHTAFDPMITSAGS